MIVVLALILAGCTAERGDGAGLATKQEEPTANGTEETTIYNGETAFLDFPEPPDSTLSNGGQEVEAMLGTYCWFSGPTEYSGGCVDTFWPLIPKQKTLTVPTGSDMVFRYRGQSPTWWPSHPPKTVEAGAYALKKLRKTATMRPNRPLEAQGPGVQRTISAELPPGGYVLEVSIKGQQYDASYYFRIVVE